MFETETEQLPNGTEALSEEDERLKQRPADIDADVREMERRKRVEALMSSKLFREELERVLDQQIHEGGDAPLLQRIRDMMGGRLHAPMLRGPSCVLPINDIRGIEGVGYEKGEKILRCKLAAVYRLVDLFGWTQTGMSGQITARLNTAIEQVLTTPRGLMPHEVTASSLVKVDMQGNVQDQGTTNFAPDVEGFSIHGAVHAARPDVRCVLHLRSPSALAVSCMKRGLLPLCTEACLLGELAYHHTAHGILDNEEQEKLVRALGPHAKVLILSSDGALCCGATLEEAFFQARQLTAACDVQLKLASLPVTELQLIDEDTRKQIYDSSRKPPGEQTKWRVGGEEFEALMRMLDNAGFRTGYIYRHPLVKNEVPKPRSDVEVPPAVSSLGYLLEEEELYRQGIWKRGRGVGGTGERTRWLNTPNLYQKVEVLETGTTDPRKITKWVDANNEEWVQDGSPVHSGTPVKIDTLQFVPKGTNPKEFKALQQQIKDNRRADKISAGPQSHILEGVTWDEAAKLVGEDAHNTHTGDHVVLMGAASKGIIQRGYQHNATVYSAPYARNPFDRISDREIDEYRRTVERKQRPDYDTDVSESEGISAAQLTSPASVRTDTEDESRGEHRVLRIETKQAPIRSQPELVLSDDATDFLHAERAHADRTKESDRDPNLLSDDEVFFDTPASSIASPELDLPRNSGQRQQSMTSKEPVVVVRAQTNVLPAQQSVIRGTLTPAHGPLTEALTSNKRILHDFSRNANLESVIKKFNNVNSQKHPKCKLSLNSKLTDDVRSDLTDLGLTKVTDQGLTKLTDFNSQVGSKMTNAFDLSFKLTDVRSDALDVYQGNASSRSSLNSIPSLEWDARCRFEHNLRTRSLPRKLKITENRFYRTQSHSGFVNFNKEPEPTHFHLPRCRSCGTTNSSYVWELTKEEKRRRTPCSTYRSVDNLHQKCLDEAKNTGIIVKVTEKVVPVFKVAKDEESEFIESQEFTEDNYFGDIGNSFSSDNETVVERDESNSQDVTVTETLVQNNVNTDKLEDNPNDTSNSATFRAELETVTAGIEDINNNNFVKETAGEYHSFTEEMDFEQAVYESPVKDLVEKDIRDYSVPIDFYCADYQNRSPGKSPSKRVEVKAVILEPILEESKSSYDDSGSTSNEKCDSKNGRQQIDEEISSYQDKENAGDVTLDRNVVIHVLIQQNKEEENFLSENIEMINNDNVAESLTTRHEVTFNSTEKVSEEIHESKDLNEKSRQLVDEDKLAANDVSSIPKEQTAMDVYSNIEEDLAADTDIADCVYQNIFEMLPNDDVFPEAKTSVDYNVSSSTELKSFNSTSEFEKYEVISELMTDILNKIYTENDNSEIFVNLPKEKLVSHFDDDTATHKDLLKEIEIDITQIEPVERSIDSTEIENFELVNESIAMLDILSVTHLEYVEQDKTNISIKETTQFLKKNSSSIDSVDVTNDGSSLSGIETFSFAKIVEEIELNITSRLTESSLTDSSDSEPNHAHKIVEGILYYIFNQSFAIADKKFRQGKEKVAKKVVTVVDPEDILFTTAFELFSETNLCGTKIRIEEENKLRIDNDLDMCDDVKVQNDVLLNEESVNIQAAIIENVIHTTEVLNNKCEVETDSERISDETVNSVTSNISVSSVSEVIDLGDKENVHEQKFALEGDLNHVSNYVSNELKKCPEQTTHNENQLVDISEHNFNETDEFIKETNKIEIVKEKEEYDESSVVISETNGQDVAQGFPDTNVITSSRQMVHNDVNIRATETLEHFQEYHHNENVTCEHIISENNSDDKEPEIYPEYSGSDPNDNQKESNKEYTYGEYITIQDTSRVETADDYPDWKIYNDFPSDEEDDYLKESNTRFNEEVASAEKSIQLNIEARENDFDKLISSASDLSQAFEGNKEKTEKYSEGNKELAKNTSHEDPITLVVDENLDIEKDFYNENSFLQDISVLPEDSASQVTLESDNLNSATDSIDNFSTVDDRSVLDISDVKHMSTETFKSDATYVIKNDNMNTAFLEEIYSRASSPNRDTSLFDACSESPINTSGNFPEDLSFYEGDGSVSESPFVKQTVISMSQSAHRGGIKYWVSFDESLTDDVKERSFKSVRRSKGSNFPSFVTLDFDNKKKRRQEFILTDDFEAKTERRSSVLNLPQSEQRGFLLADVSQSDQSDLNIEDCQIRKGVLFDEYNQSKDSNLIFEKSSASYVSTDYFSCESEPKSKEIGLGKRLIYDTRMESQNNSSRRLYGSWPPYEDTLFYRIISKFRMTESFDPSDFENLTFDSSS